MIKIIGTELYQWDTGREVSVTADGATHVHFANVGDQKAVELDCTDSVKIPDCLLTTGRQLVVYAVKKAENQDGKIVTITIEKRTFGVTHRERPENYIYSEDERNYIYELIRSATEAISGAKSIAEEIRTAKENGEFDGEKGDKGEKGEPGAPGEKGDPGEKGADGYTPQRGTDYWTEEDQEAIRDYIDGEIHNEAENMPLIYHKTLTQDTTEIWFRYFSVSDKETARVQKYKNILIFLKIPDNSDISTVTISFKFYARFNYSGSVVGDGNFGLDNYAYNLFSQSIKSGNRILVSWIGANNGSIPILKEGTTVKQSYSTVRYPTPVNPEDNNLFNYARGILIKSSSATQLIPAGTEICIYGDEIMEV